MCMTSSSLGVVKLSSGGDASLIKRPIIDATGFNLKTRIPKFKEGGISLRENKCVYVCICLVV